jgi:hypothetical protein
VQKTKNGRIIQQTVVKKYKYKIELTMDTTPTQPFLAQKRISIIADEMFERNVPERLRDPSTLIIIISVQFLSKI